MGILQALAGAGNLLDLPGSMVRDTLALRNPLDQLLTPFSHENRTTGRDLLRKYGLVGTENNWGNFGAGMAVDILTDPLTWVGGSLARKAFGGAAEATGTAGDVAAATARGADNIAPAAQRIAGKSSFSRRGNLLPELPPSTAPRPSLNPISPDVVPPKNVGVVGRTVASPSPPQVGGLNRWFYSRLERAAESQLPAGKPLKSQSVLNMLRKAPEGISPEEVRLTKLEDFLKGSPVVTRDEVLSHLRQNSVKSQIQRWSYGADHPSLPKPTHDVTRYGNYQPIPVGGYKETLFHHPQGSGNYIEPHWSDWVWSGMDNAADLASPDNVLFHLRSGVANPAKGGQPSYMLHELQSDLHQAGSKYGYSTAENAAITAKHRAKMNDLESQIAGLDRESQSLVNPKWERYRGRANEIENAVSSRMDKLQLEAHRILKMLDNNPDLSINEINALNARFSNIVKENNRLRRRAVSNHHLGSRSQRVSKFKYKGNEARAAEIDDLRTSLDEQIKAIRDRIVRNTVEYPDAPFRDSWRSVGAKQALLDAIDQGASRVIVPPGDQVRAVVGGVLSGQRRFYDDLLPAEFDKIAESVGSPARMSALSVAHPKTGAAIPTKAIELADLAERIRRRGGLPLLSILGLSAAPMMMGGER